MLKKEISTHPFSFLIFLKLKLALALGEAGRCSVSMARRAPANHGTDSDVTAKVLAPEPNDFRDAETEVTPSALRGSTISVKFLHLKTHSQVFLPGLAARSLQLVLLRVGHQCCGQSWACGRG